MVDHQDYIVLSTWLTELNNNLNDGPTISQVPSSARNIHTPLVYASWVQALQHCPNQLLTSFFSNVRFSGIQNWVQHATSRTKVCTQKPDGCTSIPSSSSRISEVKSQ